MIKINTLFCGLVLLSMLPTFAFGDDNQGSTREIAPVIRKLNAFAGLIILEGNGADVPSKSLVKYYDKEISSSAEQFYSQILHHAIEDSSEDCIKAAILDPRTKNTSYVKSVLYRKSNFINEYFGFLSRNFEDELKGVEILSVEALRSALQNVSRYNKSYLERRQSIFIGKNGELSNESHGLYIGEDIFYDAIIALKISFFAQLVSRTSGRIQTSSGIIVVNGPFVNGNGSAHTYGVSFFLDNPVEALKAVVMNLPMYLQYSNGDIYKGLERDYSDVENLRWLFSNDVSSSSKARLILGWFLFDFRTVFLAIIS